MTCSCGDVMDIEAETRGEAVSKMKAMMTQEAIASHMAEKHPSDPVMSVEDCHAMIEKHLTPVENSANPMV